MYAWCWAVCRILQETLPPLVHNISSQYLLFPSLHLLLLQFTHHWALPSGLTATGLPPSIRRTILGLEESLEMDPSGIWLRQPPMVTPSTNTHHACPVTVRGHTTQPWDCTAETFAELQPSFGLLLMLGSTKGWHWFYCLGSLETLQSSALFKIA